MKKRNPGLPDASPEEDVTRDVLMTITPCRKCDLGGVCQCALDVRAAIYRAGLNILSDAAIEAIECAARPYEEADRHAA